MPVNVSVTVEDWQAVAQQYLAENAQLRASLQAAGRKVSELAQQLEAANATEEGDESQNGVPEHSGVEEVRKAAGSGSSDSTVGEEAKRQQETET